MGFDVHTAGFKMLKPFRFRFFESKVKAAKALFLITILLAISSLAIKTGSANPDWDAYEYAYDNSISGFDPLYLIFSEVSLSLFNLSYFNFYFFLVFLNLAMIAYLIRNPFAALLGCVSLFMYIETNVGVQIRWGLAATTTMIALQFASKRLTGLLGIGSILFQFFALVPISLIILISYFWKKLESNTSILFCTIAALVLMVYFDSIINLIIPSESKYFGYLNSDFSNYKSTSSIVYIFVMFGIEIIILKYSNICKLDRCNIIMTIYIRIIEIASFSFMVISGRLLIYSMLLEVLVIRGQLRQKNKGLLLIYVLLSSSKIVYWLLPQ